MSTLDNTSSDKRDVYARVTDQIINAIEQGALVGQRWRLSDGAFYVLPQTKADGRSVHGQWPGRSHRVSGVAFAESGLKPGN